MTNLRFGWLFFKIRTGSGNCRHWRKIWFLLDSIQLNRLSTNLKAEKLILSNISLRKHYSYSDKISSDRFPSSSSMISALIRFDIHSNDIHIFVRILPKNMRQYFGIYLFYSRRSFFFLFILLQIINHVTVKKYGFYFHIEYVNLAINTLFLQCEKNTRMNALLSEHLSRSFVYTWKW